MPIAAAESPPSSEREERVFTIAFSIMDSSEDGEAVAAFLRVRDLLHRRGGTFRRMLERYEEAERLNENLGRQNTRLLRENAALRARYGRLVPAAALLGGARRLLSRPAVQGFRHWDIGFMAFTHWFSPARLFAGIVLAVAAYVTAVPAPAKTLRPTTAGFAVAEAPLQWPASP
jgi:hypothetical protein